jgi:hypothetical protein
VRSTQEAAGPDSSRGSGLEDRLMLSIRICGVPPQRTVVRLTKVCGRKTGDFRPHRQSLPWWPPRGKANLT